MGAGRFDAVDVGSDVVAKARAFAVAETNALGHDDLTDDVELVTSELTTNAVLHAGGVTSVHVVPMADGVRIEVRDRTRITPLLALASTEAMTGRGLRVVTAVAARWKAEPEAGGKVVWAELSAASGPAAGTVDDVLDVWSDDGWDVLDAPSRHVVTLGAVPTDLLVAAKAHVDNLVREFTLASTGAVSGVSAEVPAHLALLIQAVVTRFAEPRQEIKRQAIVAANNGQDHVDLELKLPASAADAAEDYLRALDEADAYCRAARLLTLETPPQHRVFRHWYVDELVKQLRAAAAGTDGPPTEPFERRLLREIDAVADANRLAARTARLYEVSAALAAAATPEAVAAAVLERGVLALGASGGGLLLATEDEFLAVPGTVGYDDELVTRLQTESRHAELPAAVALQSGEPVWLESPEDRDLRFPELLAFERATVSLCAVPLIARGRKLGALRFSFSERRLFDDDERRFVLALAAQAGQALDRAQLFHQRLDLSRRLQRSLLPGRLPEIPGLDVAFVYHPLGDGMEVGGDFYDLWSPGPGRWAVAVGDAAGTGPEAAALTAMTRYTLRALMRTDDDPRSVMTNLNGVLFDAEASGEAGERFCTVLLGVLRLGDPIRVGLASGGHPHPMIQHADGTVDEVSIDGALVGVFERSTVGSRELGLQPGDSLVLFTDGTLEARDAGGQFGTDGIRAAIAAAPVGDAVGIATTIEDAVLRYSRGVLEDDLTVLVLTARR